MEFQEVMKQRNRMCKKYWTSRSCHGCPVAEESQAYEGCCLIDFDPKRYEELVLKWAADNPDPEYPTWAEYLKTFGFPGGITIPLDCDLRGCPPIERFVWLAENHVPADIAQKLGIEPKEG